MNIYSSAPFLEAFKQAYFPGTTLHFEDFSLQGQTWRLITLPNKQPISTWEFIDFFEPVPSSEIQNTSQSVHYIAKACHGIVTTEEWFDKNLFVCYQASPLIDWTSYTNWDAFTAHVKSKCSNIFSDSQRRKRKLERNLGSVTFVWQDTRTEIFDSCFQWKSEKYLHSQTLFPKPNNIRFFQELANNDLLVVSSLSASNKLLAVSIGALWEGRFYGWIMAYDPQYASYSPGRLMMHSIMETSYQQGHREFDFLVGGESYKWYYATHTRLIAEMGGLTTSVKALVKKQLSQQLSRFPGTGEKLRKNEKLKKIKNVLQRYQII